MLRICGDDKLVFVEEGVFVKGTGKVLIEWLPSERGSLARLRLT